MSFDEQVTSLTELLPQLQTITVLLGPSPTYDQVAAALSLTQSLKAAGKEVLIATPNDLDESMETLLDLDLVQQKLGNQNLSIKFPYDAQSVDKVSYHISDDNQTFYLVIKPQRGSKPLDAKQVTFDYTGAEADLVILIGVHQLESLEHLYQGFEELFERVSIVTIHTFETAIGHIKLDISSQVCFSQAMSMLLQKLQLPIAADSATNLLSGVEVATDGFTSPLVTADTFETVANLMRSGARRLKPIRVKPEFYSNGQSSLLESTDGEVRPSKNNTNIFAQKLMSNKPGSFTIDGELPPDVAQPKKTKKKKKSNEPGGLDYQPGAEGGMARG